MRQNEADFYKDKLDGESSVNKILFRAIDNLELPYTDKLRFLQLARHDQRA